MKQVLLLAALFLVIAVPGYSQEKPPPFKGCPPEGNDKNGNALSQSKQDLNLLKNRDKPPKLLDHTITLDRIMKASEDGKFKNSEGASIIGYVAEVKAGEPRETCNCARDDIADIHIDVVLKESDKSRSSNFMIVEITPRWQDKLGDLAKVKEKIEGQCVQFTGWMLNDSVHRANAKNTNPKGKAIWRRTSWEIHPVTAMKVVDCP